jgi:hypothetical protein
MASRKSRVSPKNPKVDESAFFKNARVQKTNDDENLKHGHFQGLTTFAIDLPGF